MSAVKQISAVARTKVGKGAARALRKNGQIPAVIYGAGKSPTPIALDAKSMQLMVYAGHFLTNLLDIKVDKDTTRVIPRDYQLDPVRDSVDHIDFLRVEAGSKLRVEIPVHALNAETAPGVKAGGSVNIVTHTLAVLAPADAIPDAIEVDVGALEINDTVHLSQIKLPKGVEYVGEGDVTLASIVAPMQEEEPAEAEVAEGETVAEEK